MNNSSNSSTFQVDEKPVIDMFKRLTGREQTKAMKRALTKAGNILVRATRSNLRGAVRNSTRKSKKYGKSLSSGVKVRVKSEKEAKVHIMGEFRLKFFEMGTKVRKTKKGYNRGRITPRYFFRKANTQTEKDMYQSMDRLLAESIQRIANRRK